MLSKVCLLRSPHNSQIPLHKPFRGSRPRFHSPRYLLRRTNSLSLVEYRRESSRQLRCPWAHHWQRAWLHMHQNQLASLCGTYSWYGVGFLLWRWVQPGSSSCLGHPMSHQMLQRERRHSTSPYHRPRQVASRCTTTSTSCRSASFAWVSWVVGCQLLTFLLYSHRRGYFCSVGKVHQWIPLPR